jgi:hypothetical protein
MKKAISLAGGYEVVPKRACDGTARYNLPVTLWS